MCISDHYRGQIDIPIPLPIDYFDRFCFYGQHVKSLTMNTLWGSDESGLSHHKVAWPAVFSRVSRCTLFPKLKTLYLVLFAKRSTIRWDWANLFIVPTLTEIYYNLPRQAGQEHSRTLESMLSKRLSLEQITLSVFEINWPWNEVANSMVPKSLKTLTVRRGTIGVPFLVWTGRIPHLEELYLQPQRWEPLNELTLPDIELPQKSFSALRVLSFINGSKALLEQLCRTFVFTGLIKLLVQILLIPRDDVTTGQLFALLAEHSPSLQDFACSGDFLLENSDIPSLHPLSLRSLKLLQSGKPGPELQISTLSGLSSTLKVLELNNYVSFDTIMRLPLCLPRLESLSVCVSPRVLPKNVDTSHLCGASLERARAIWLSHPFTLTIISDRWRKPELEKLDMCAKYVNVFGSLFLHSI